MIIINPSLEALCFGRTLSIFAGDRTLTFRGRDNITLLENLRRIFSEPRTEEQVREIAPEIFELIPDLLNATILVRETSDIGVTFVGTGRIQTALSDVLPSVAEHGAASVVICLPDKKGLAIQKQALASLKAGQRLITGIYRGTSVFVLPFISDPDADLLKMMARLLSTERGVGNSYLTEELHEESEENLTGKGVIEEVARWVATDLYALLKNGKFDGSTARIYRGSYVVREDVPFGIAPIPIGEVDSLEEKTEALTKMFVGNARPIGWFTDFFIGTAQNPVHGTRAGWARPRTYCQQENEEQECWGTGNTRLAARIAALMEGLERYAAGAYAIGDFPLCPRDILDKPVLDRLAITGYGKMDKYCNDLPSGAPRRWFPVKSVITGKEHYAPLELVCYPIYTEELGYIPVDRVNSSGMAAHFSRNTAIQSACHELVERDAFMIAWLRRAKPPLIDLESVPSAINREIRMLVEAGWTVRIMDLTTDIAPVILVLLSRKTEIYRLALGASSKDDMEEACMKALREAQLTFSLVQATPQPGQEIAQKQLDNILSPNDHIDLYAFGKYDHLLTELFDSRERRRFSEMRRFSGNIVTRLWELGREVFVADFRNELIQEAAANIQIVRAIIPGLVPMHFGQNWSRTGSPRIQTIPELVGWPTCAKDEECYQLFPHPFH